MSSIRILMITSLVTFCAVKGANAQEVKPLPSANQTVAAPTITALASANRVRLTAPNTVMQMHLQVYDNAGQLVFDVSSKGNVLDWTLQDSGGERLVSGAYLSVVTVKSLSGKISQRVGTVSVQDKQIELHPVEAMQMTAGQQQAVGPIEQNGALTILKAGEADAVTVVAHDGTQGEINRSNGALSFRLGDFYSGKDEEQMRLTEAGNLGVGTDNPQAKLDVAGVIRTRDGIEFGSGEKTTKLTTTATGSLQQTMSDGTVVTNATGSGTQDKLAKWTDNAGTLGDAAVTESGGAVVVGNGSQTGNLQIFGPANSDVFAGMGLDVNVGPAFNYGYAGGSFGRSAGFFNVRPDALATPPNPSLRFMTANVQRMIVDNTGNVGIGTLAPGAKLDVAGNINTSTQFNIRGNRVLSVTGGGIFTNSNTFVGVDAGVNNTATSDSFGSGNVNSFFGSQAGASNTTGRENSFFGEAAGISEVSGVGNSVFGRDAALSLNSGNDNSHFGHFAGAANFSGSNNTFIGASTNSSGNLTNATAIGYQAMVTQSNSLILGSIVGTSNGGSVDTNVGIGTTAPARRLHVNGTGSDSAGQTDLRVTGTGTTASGITLESTGSGGKTYSLLSTANAASGGPNGGGRLAVFDVTAGAYRMVIDDTGNVGIGTFTPSAKLDVNGAIKFTTVPAGTGAALCWDSTTALIVNCSASSARYKQNIFGLRLGLDVVRRLHPVSFTWKEDGQRDLGLVAEDVNRVEPLLVTHNARGEVEGVRYDRLGVVLVNAVNEQQLQIEAQQKQIKEQNELIKKQQTEVEVLRVLVCSQNVNADICKPKN